MIVRHIVRQIHHKASKARIYLSKDETCFVSHHGTDDHPYESTKPLPIAAEKPISNLKVDSRNMITKAPNFEQVQNLTYTPRSYWRQDQGKAKRERYKKYFDALD